MLCQHGYPTPNTCIECLKDEPPQQRSHRYRYSRPLRSRLLTVHEESCSHCDTGFGHWVEDSRPDTMTWLPDESVAEGMRAAEVLPAVLGAEGVELTFGLCGSCLRTLDQPARSELAGAMAAFEREHIKVIELPVG